MLKLVSDPKQIKRAWNTLESELKRGSVRRRGAVGNPAGSYTYRLIVREDLGIWAITPFEITDDHGPKSIWFPLGVLPLPEKKNASMVVQINPSLRPSTATSAFLALDASTGDQWVCHSGRVGGGRHGISKSGYRSWTDRVSVKVERGGRPSIESFPIARVGDPNLAADIAEFVQEIHDFKEGRKPLRPHRSVAAPLPFEEFEGTQKVRPRDGYDANRFHGVVCNRLIELIQAAGHKVANDKHRDAFIGDPRSPEVQFEIKPSASWQDLYTAVGQLMLHSVEAPAKRRVLVVPDRLDERKRASIEALGVRVLAYREDRTHIHFDGLSKVVRGTTDSAPLRRVRTSPMKKAT